MRCAPMIRFESKFTTNPILPVIIRLIAPVTCRFPLAGRVKAAGLTASQLERSITSRLKGGILNDPRVSVQVSTYAPIYIHGEVKKSGDFPFRPGLTVMDAVAAAGGFTYRADDSRAYVRRSGTAAELVYPLDTRVLVFPGDNIRIPERFF